MDKCALRLQREETREGLEPEGDCLHVDGGSTGGFFGGREPKTNRKRGNRKQETFLKLKRIRTEENTQGVWRGWWDGSPAKRNLLEVIDFAEEKIRLKVIGLYSASAVKASSLEGSFPLEYDSLVPKKRAR